MEEEHKKKSKVSVAEYLGLGLIVLAVVLFLGFFLRGQTTVTGAYPGAVSDKTLSCNVHNISYPFFDSEPNKKDTEVTVLFKGDEFKAISLKHTLYYNNEKEVKDSEAINHAAMGILFGQNGLEADAFSLAFSMQEDQLIYSIYANDSDFVGTAGRYFLANNLTKKSTFESFESKYKNQGFACTTN